MNEAQETSLFGEKFKNFILEHVKCKKKTKKIVSSLTSSNEDKVRVGLFGRALYTPGVEGGQTNIPLVRMGKGVDSTMISDPVYGAQKSSAEQSSKNVSMSLHQKQLVSKETLKMLEKRAIVKPAQ